MKSKIIVAGLTNFSHFFSVISSRYKENKNSVYVIIWAFFGTFDVMRSEYEYIKAVKITTIDSLIKDDVDDDEVKRWKWILMQISIFGLLCASVKLVCSSWLLFNTKLPGIIPSRVVTKIFNGERGILPAICCTNLAREEVNKVASIWY